MSARQENFIKSYARGTRAILDILDDGLVEELRAVYDYSSMKNSEHVKQLIREGCFTEIEKETWARSEETSGLPLTAFPEEERVAIQELRNARDKLTRIVRRILAKLLKEVFFDQAKILEEEAAKRRLSGGSVRSLPSVAPTPDKALVDDSSVLTAEVFFSPPVAASRPRPQTPEATEPVSLFVEEDEAEEEEADSEYSPDGEVEVEAPRRKPMFRNQARIEDSQQLYETNPADVAHLAEYLRAKAPLLNRVFEPCYGNGAIGKALEGHGYEMSVVRDLYTLREKHDFLEAPFPEPESYDLIVTNTPFQNKVCFLARLFATGKPFCAIFPADVLCSSRDVPGLKFLVPPHHMKFLHQGEWNYYGSKCFWFLGNFDEDGLRTNGSFTFEYL